MKYPLPRLAHIPERYLGRHLYFDFSRRMQPRHRVPEDVPVPEHRYRPPIPELETVEIHGASSGFAMVNENFG